MTGLGTALLTCATGLVRGDTSDVKNVITGKAAFTSYKGESPGTFRKITVADLPDPYATEAVSNGPKVVARPADAWPKAPPGFTVQLYTQPSAPPREVRTAPNGDLFVAESYKGQVEVFRGITPDGKPEQQSIFATGLRNNFGIAFYPLGSNPQWVYIGNTNSVVRFPYKSGDLKASGPPETIIPKLPAGGGHWTRDLAFSPDGKKLFVAVGSASNVAENDPELQGPEFHRANILEFTPEGKFVKVYASGIRNPVGIAIDPSSGHLWCSVNERDNLGDNLVPDYITSVKEDGFYGWPWYYMGDHQDPRHAGKHPELKGKVIVPDVLLQPHNASLEMTFYEANQFPKEYEGDIFAAEHGSWNRAARSGYEVVRVPLKSGKAAGEYEDFLTGFVTSDGNAWGRPVGVAVASDGSLMVTDDGSKSIWRITYAGSTR
ncbi:MAG: sorbosone dehydrogenase family protein [Acidobacteriaceae bacterium]|nr:sorbosone dehydrogenase family protein [Acidobacteriaceae bacterium]